MGGDTPRKVFATLSVDGKKIIMFFPDKYLGDWKERYTQGSKDRGDHEAVRRVSVDGLETALSYDSTIQPLGGKVYSGKAQDANGDIKSGLILEMPNTERINLKEIMSYLQKKKIFEIFPGTVVDDDVRIMTQKSLRFVSESKSRRDLSQSPTESSTRSTTGSPSGSPSGSSTGSPESPAGSGGLIFSPAQLQGYLKVKDERRSTRVGDKQSPTDSSPKLESPGSPSQTKN